MHDAAAALGRGLDEAVEDHDEIFLMHSSDLTCERCDQLMAVSRSCRSAHAGVAVAAPRVRTHPPETRAPNQETHDAAALRRGLDEAVKGIRRIKLRTP
uniref:Uncharacterized protein n=1 Tax=Oryza sativa subsp. japonica TaxID=39947 RepID=Q2R1A8_ORYSJ|nr:hypothetical protein LOC_Os11g39800 [Oryza sativa Japonica Group]